MEHLQPDAYRMDCVELIRTCMDTSQAVLSALLDGEQVPNERTYLPATSRLEHPTSSRTRSLFDIKAAGCVPFAGL